MSKIFFFLLALFSASSQAFTTLDPYMVDAEVRKVNNFVSVDGDTVKVNVMGKGYGANQPYFNKTISIPKNRFLSWVKSNLKNLLKINPWWAVWAAAMAAFGWAFDELLDQIKKPIYKTKYTGKVGQFNEPTYLSGVVYPFPDAVTKVLGECRSSGGKNCASTSILTIKTAPNLYTFPVTFTVGTGSPVTRQINFFVVTQDDEIVSSEPISDQSLFDSLMAQMLQNPTAAAQAMTSPSGYPYDDLFKGLDLKYIPGVSEADYPALDCYFRGALQTSNSGGACYATEAEYQRIKQIAEQIKTNATPNGQADAMNDKLKDPLTQAQFEESLNKLKDSDASKVTDDASKIYDDGFKQLNDSIVANTLPGMPDLMPIPQIYTGTCRSIPLNFNLAGVNITKQFPGETGCAQFEKMKEFLGWLMAVGVAIGLMFAALREAN